jgi:hypothetical protein
MLLVRRISLLVLIPEWAAAVRAVRQLDCLFGRIAD